MKNIICFLSSLFVVSFISCVSFADTSDKVAFAKLTKYKAECEEVDSPDSRTRMEAIATCNNDRPLYISAKYDPDVIIRFIAAKRLSDEKLRTKLRKFVKTDTSIDLEDRKRIYRILKPAKKKVVKKVSKKPEAKTEKKKVKKKKKLKKKKLKKKKKKKLKKKKKKKKKKGLKQYDPIVIQPLPNKGVKSAINDGDITVIVYSGKRTWSVKYLKKKLKEIDPNRINDIIQQAGIDPSTITVFEVQISKGKKSKRNDALFKYLTKKAQKKNKRTRPRVFVRQYGQWYSYILPRTKSALRTVLKIGRRYAKNHGIYVDDIEL